MRKCHNRVPIAAPMLNCSPRTTLCAILTAKRWGFGILPAFLLCIAQASVSLVYAIEIGRIDKVRTRLWVTIEGAAGAGTNGTVLARTASIHLAVAVIFPHATISGSRIGLAAVAAVLVMIGALAAAIASAAVAVDQVAAAVAALVAVAAVVSTACPHR